MSFIQGIGIFNGSERFCKFYPPAHYIYIKSKTTQNVFSIMNTFYKLIGTVKLSSTVAVYHIKVKT